MPTLRPARAVILAVIVATRLALGAIAWIAIEIAAQMALFPPDGGIPHHGESWPLWLLPVAWAAATLGGSWMAAGGGLAAPWARAAPLLAFAAWLVAESAAVMTPPTLYAAWAGSLVAVGYGSGLQLATRQRSRWRGTNGGTSCTATSGQARRGERS